MRITSSVARLLATLLFLVSGMFTSLLPGPAVAQTSDQQAFDQLVAESVAQSPEFGPTSGEIEAETGFHGYIVDDMFFGDFFASIECYEVDDIPGELRNCGLAAFDQSTLEGILFLVASSGDWALLQGPLENISASTVGEGSAGHLIDLPTDHYSIQIAIQNARVLLGVNGEFLAAFDVTSLASPFILSAIGANRSNPLIFENFAIWSAETIAPSSATSEVEPEQDAPVAAAGEFTSSRFGFGLSWDDNWTETFASTDEQSFDAVTITSESVAISVRGERVEAAGQSELLSPGECVERLVGQLIARSETDPDYQFIAVDPPLEQVSHGDVPYAASFWEELYTDSETGELRHGYLGTTCFVPEDGQRYIWMIVTVPVADYAEYHELIQDVKRSFVIVDIEGGEPGAGGEVEGDASVDDGVDSAFANTWVGTNHGISFSWDDNWAVLADESIGAEIDKLELGYQDGLTFATVLVAPIGTYGRDSPLACVGYYYLLELMSSDRTPAVMLEPVLHPIASEFNEVAQGLFSFSQVDQSGQPWADHLVDVTCIQVPEAELEIIVYFMGHTDSVITDRAYIGSLVGTLHTTGDLSSTASVPEAEDASTESLAVVGESSYSNPRYGFAIEWQEPWSFVEALEPLVGEAVYIGSNVGGFVPLMSTWEETGNQTIDDCVAGYDPRNFDYNENITVLLEERWSAPGIEAVRFVAQYEDHILEDVIYDRYVDATCVWFVEDDVVLKLHFNGSPEQFIGAGSEERDALRSGMTYQGAPIFTVGGADGILPVSFAEEAWND
ncbi:MAG: hypothetical protein M9947_19145 [Thermomicrobiales bacterium]|nr:hypothetical protein [Thermomicrobiales bacterium]